MRLTFVGWPSLRRYRTASKTEPKLQLTDEQWLLIADLFPWKPPTRKGGRPTVPPRVCLEGILWVLRTGARWKDLPDYFDNTWTLTDILFSAFQGKEAFINPVYHQLRHPLIFYYGHPTAFYVNKGRLAGLIDHPINSEYEEKFEVGVDEMRWDDDLEMKDSSYWPNTNELIEYRRTVYQMVKKWILEHPELEENHAPINSSCQLWALFMAMEHEKIHLETSSVLMQEVRKII